MNERRRRAWHWRAWRRLWPSYQRLVGWWQRYVGSVAFICVLVMIVVASKIDENRTTRLVRVEVAQEQARHERQAERLSAQVAANTERLERERLELERETARQQELERVRTQIMREANIADCQRINTLRDLLRGFAARQLEIAQRMPLRETSLTEWVRLMGDYNSSLVRLHNDLQRVNCAAAYSQQ